MYSRSGAEMGWLHYKFSLSYGLPLTCFRLIFWQDIIDDVAVLIEQRSVLIISVLLMPANAVYYIQLECA